MPKLHEDIFLIAALRTPIGKFGGALASMTAPQLGVASAKATIERSGIDKQAIDEVIFGNARQAGVGPNAARQIAIKGGLRHEVPAYPVNQACGSGLRAIMNAADQIRLGHGATAETLADRYKISRREQDEYAVDTQRRAKAAYDENRFANEIVPLEKLDRDEHPRFDADLGSLAKLPAASSAMRRRASTRRSWASDRFPRRSGCCAKSG